MRWHIKGIMAAWMNAANSCQQADGREAKQARVFHLDGNELLALAVAFHLGSNNVLLLAYRNYHTADLD
jgi:hypothetical protein